MRARPGIRVAVVVAGKFFREQRKILQASCKESYVIEGARQLENSRPRNQPVRRLEAVHAAERRRPDHRAVGLAAQRKRQHARCNRGGRPGGRAARRVLRVVRIARLAGMEIGALGGHRLAENHRAGGAQFRHHHGIFARRAARMQDGAVFRGHVAGVDNVLDAQWHAAEWADCFARAAHFVRRACLRERVLLVEKGPGLHFRLEFANALEAGADEFLGAQLAVTDLLRAVRRRKTHRA